METTILKLSKTQKSFIESVKNKDNSRNGINGYAIMGTQVRTAKALELMNLIKVQVIGNYGQSYVTEIYI
jgi:hypothetical protein